MAHPKSGKASSSSVKRTMFGPDSRRFKHKLRRKSATKTIANRYASATHAKVIAEREDSPSTPDATILVRKPNPDRRIASSKPEEPKFDTIERIPSKILDISPERVTMKCLMDATNSVFQIRSFDRLPLEGAVALKVGQLVEIKIMTRPGERRFLFKKLSGKKVEALFEEKNIFEGLENTRAFSGIRPEK